MTYANLVDFVDWLDRDLLAGGPPLQAVSGNVRHCFDVSLFELWTSWTRRVPLSSPDPRDFANSRRRIARYAANRVGLWVSTPSALAALLRDPAFGAAALPALRTFLFCGEVLSKPLVRTLWKRFPKARVINTYGPTECTVAVTAQEVDARLMATPDPLPIGRPRPGARLTLEAGEIVIEGPCVGTGYVDLPDRQAAAFPAPGRYRTGDRGHVDATGVWQFAGRRDREVKIQGVRIDLTEIEASIAELAGTDAVIVAPHVLRGVPRALMVHIGGLAEAAALPQIAAALARRAPPQSVPRFWYGTAACPLGPGGKLDRAALTARAAKDWSHVHA